MPELLEVQLEVGDDISNGPPKLPKRFDDRLKRVRARVNERYLLGDLAVHIHGGFPSIVKHRFCAVFVNFAEIIDRVSARNGYGFLARRVALSTCDAPNSEQVVVLVGDVEGVNDSEGVTVSTIPGYVGLQPIDDCLNGGTHALYRSAITLQSSFVAGCGGIEGVDRETRLLARRAAIGENKLPDRLVETGSEIMDTFSDKHAQSGRNILAHEWLNSILKNISIVAGDSTVNVLCHKGFDFAGKIDDVLFGPF